MSYPEKAFGNPKALRAYHQYKRSPIYTGDSFLVMCRWPIEVFFRQCKDKLALDSYQIRSAYGNQKVLATYVTGTFQCAVGTW
ncbi:MAG: hypothetical protein ACLT1J_10995 [Mediterraneibacter gnavus]